MAKAILEESLSQPTSTPCTWRDDREVYLEEIKQELRRCLIEPIPVTGLARDWAQKHAHADNVVREYYAIARRVNTWLLYSTESKEFAQADGTDISKPLEILRTSSDDALAEWLG